MLNSLKTKEFWIHLFLFTCIVLLLGGFIFLLTEVKKLNDSKGSELSTQFIYTSDGTCGEDCRRKIEEELAKIESQTSGPSPTPTILKVTSSPGPTSATKKTTYVPFSGASSTTSTNWTDVSGSQAYVDLKNNYSSTAYVTFEAVIRTSPGGQSFARLFDATNGIAVSGSEVSTSSTSATLVSSGKLNLWNGNNLYKVQIKSLNSYTVYFDSGSIKLVY